MIKQLAMLILIMFGFMAGFILLIKSVEANEGIYYQFGINVHSVEHDSPEINLPMELGCFSFGYTFKLDKLNSIDLYFKHTSALFYTESGYGLNQLGIQYRGYMK